MALKFWLGGASSDKSRRLIKYILDDAALHPDRQYLYVVPEQFGLATQRELVMTSDNRGILNIDVLSFTRLAHRISDEVGSYSNDATTLDDMGKSLIIGMLAGENKRELSVFGDNLDKPGYVDKIKSLISEFMQYGISPEKVRELSAMTERDGKLLLAAKLKDVALLYEKFKEYIRDKYTTVEETLDSVSTLVPDSLTIKNSVIVFDGFTGFTPVQNKLIGVLLEYALSVNIALLYDDCIQEDNGSTALREHELFYLSKNTMNQLGRMADERHVVIEDPYKACNININNTSNPKDDVVYKDGSHELSLNNIEVELLSAHNPDEEIQMVFNRIVSMVRTYGYHYKDIAILTGDIESYRHIIEREFSKHDIPFFIDRTEPILLNPFIEYIRSFLGIFAENYSIPSVFGFLKSYLTDFSQRDICMLENYCIGANIKGRRSWHGRFDRLTRTVGADELLTLNELRERFVKRCDDFLAKLSPSGTIHAGSVFTIKEFSAALYSMIISDGIEEKLKGEAKRLAGNGNRRMASEYEQIYVRIMNVLDELCELIPYEKTDIRGFINLLNAGFDNIRIGSAPMGMDYIQVGDLTRSRLSDVKALFIVGANDGIIPRMCAAAGIINENEREYLSGDVRLAPSVREDIYTQRLYIYMALHKPTDRLLVSYPLTSESGVSLMPSYIIGGLKAAGGKMRAAADAATEHYADEAAAFEDLCRLLNPALTGRVPGDMGDRIKGLLKYFIKSEKYRERLLRMIREWILKREVANDSIGRALAHTLYGERIVTSITRLEGYAACAYRYFLEYGLRLSEREVFSFEARDIGNIFHDSMRAYSVMIEDKGLNWAKLSEKEQNELMDSAVDAVMEQYRRDKLSSSARYAYMENRIRKIMRRSADVIGRQIRQGSFVPKYFEVDFDSLSDNDTLSMKLSDGDIMRLRGRIDRVDTCETDDGVYIRVIDYKSSTHEMDLAAVYEGRQLQLIVYLNAAMGMEKGQHGKKDIIPAGILYYHMDDPVVAAKEELTAEDINTLIMKELSLKGLVNSDRDVIKLMDRDYEQGSSVLPVSLTAKGEIKATKQTVSADEFEVMSDYVTKCIRNMGDEIMRGNIAIPHPDGKHRFTGPDCRFCPYVSVCGSAERDRNAGTGGDTLKKSNSEWIGLMGEDNESD